MSYGKTLDAILGECGITQIWIQSCFFSTGFLAPWVMVMMGFVGAQPKWWSVSKHLNTTSNITYIIQNKKVCPSGNESVVFDKSIYTIVNEWKLICGKDWTPSFLVTVQMVGVLIGCASAGHFGDWIGRKKCYLTAYITMVISILIEGFSVNWYMMAVSMFCLGIGAGGYLSIDLVFRIEFVSSKWRTIVGAIPSWGIALMVLGGLIKLFPNWRHLCIALSVLGSVLFLPLWFIPESIRWLLTKNRKEEAEAILKKLAASSNLHFEEDMEIEALQKDATKENARDHSINYLTLFRFKETRYKSLIFGFIWAYCSFSYYGITLGVGNLQGDLSVNMVVMGLSDAVTGVVIWLAAKILQRRNSTIFLFAITAATSFVITIAYAADASNYDKIKYSFSLVSRFFLSASYSSIVIFTVESFPTEIRSIAFSFANFMARFGGIAAAQNAALSKLADHLPLTVNGSLAVVSCILCIFLKDTYTEDLADYLESETEMLTRPNDSDEN